MSLLLGAIHGFGQQEAPTSRGFKVGNTFQRGRPFACKRVGQLTMRAFGTPVNSRFKKGRSARINQSPHQSGSAGWRVVASETNHLRRAVGNQTEAEIRVAVSATALDLLLRPGRPCGRRPASLAWAYPHLGRCSII